MRLIERGIETALVLIVAVACATLMDSGQPTAGPGGVDGVGEARVYAEVEASGEVAEIRSITDEEVAGRRGGSAEAVVQGWNQVTGRPYGMRAGQVAQTRVRP